MKKNFFIFSIIFLFCFNLFSQANDPAIGYWQSVDEKTNKITGIWKTEVKGDSMLYGCLVWIPDENPEAKAIYCTKVSKYDEFTISDPANQPIINTPWLYKLRFDEKGSWKKGHIIDPTDGKHYYSSVKYKNGTLVMRGSLDKNGVFGRSQVWKTISEAEVNKLVAEAKAKYGLK